MFITSTFGVTATWVDACRARQRKIKKRRGVEPGGVRKGKTDRYQLSHIAQQKIGVVHELANKNDTLARWRPVGGFYFWGFLIRLYPAPRADVFFLVFFFWGVFFCSSNERRCPSNQPIVPGTGCAPRYPGVCPGGGGA